MALDELKQYLENIAQDLLNLEINTIIKDNMTGRKMPEPPHALIDIAQVYVSKLEALKIFPPYVDPSTRKPKTPPFYDEVKKAYKYEAISNEDDTFNHIRELASQGVNPERASSDNIILIRILRNCDQLKTICCELHEKTGNEMMGARGAVVKGMKKKMNTNLDQDDAIKLRKIWEMGVEVVAMQTVVQLDGDTITRVQKDYAVEEKRYVAELHAQAIQTAIGSWRFLAQTIGSFITSLAGLVKK